MRTVSSMVVAMSGRSGTCGRQLRAAVEADLDEVVRMLVVRDWLLSISAAQDAGVKDPLQALRCSMSCAKKVFKSSLAGKARTCSSAGHDISGSCSAIVCFCTAQVCSSAVQVRRLFERPDLNRLARSRTHR